MSNEIILSLSAGSFTQLRECCSVVAIEADCHTCPTTILQPPQFGASTYYIVFNIEVHVFTRDYYIYKKDVY